jgi:hypothetical protein
MRSTQSKQRVRAGHFNFTAYLNKAGLTLTINGLAQRVYIHFIPPALHAPGPVSIEHISLLPQIKLRLSLMMSSPTIQFVFSSTPETALWLPAMACHYTSLLRHFQSSTPSYLALRGRIFLTPMTLAWLSLLSYCISVHNLRRLSAVTDLWISDLLLTCQN